MFYLTNRVPVRSQNIAIVYLPHDRIAERHAYIHTYIFPTHSETLNSTYLYNKCAPSNLVFHPQEVKQNKLLFSQVSPNSHLGCTVVKTSDSGS